MELLDANTKTKVKASVPSSISIQPNSSTEKPFTITVDSSLPQGVYTGNIYVKNKGQKKKFEFHSHLVSILKIINVSMDLKLLILLLAQMATTY